MIVHCASQKSRDTAPTGDDVSTIPVRLRGSEASPSRLWQRVVLWSRIRNRNRAGDLGGPCCFELIEMTRPRILLTYDETRREHLLVDDERAHYLLHVLRLRPGDCFVAVAPQGRELEMEITGVTDGVVRARLVGTREASTEPLHAVHVALGVLKAKTMDWALQKVTEVGAVRIVPLLATRCVVRADAEQWQAKRQRWAQLAAEAARQCGRFRAPSVSAPVTVAELADHCRDSEVRWLLLDPQAKARASVTGALEGAEAAGVILGPEGDLTDDEKGVLRKAGAVPVSLGPRVLRAETAAVVACVLALYHFGDLG